MSFCEYCRISNYNELCKCSKNNDICPLVRRCSTRHAWIPLDSMSSCSIRMAPRKEDIVLNANEYRVEFERNKKLWVDYKGSLIIFSNPYDYTPDKVELVKVDNALYIKGFEPKPPKQETSKSKSKKGDK